jgi:hypothetical protein
MSITRLQQARQMYATGQKVERVAFGGGGSQNIHGGQYQGAGASNKTHSKSHHPTQGVVSHSPQSVHSGADSSHVSNTQQYNHNEAMEKNNPEMKNPLRPEGVKPGFIKPEDAVDLGLTLRPHEQQRVDFLKIPYKPDRTPFLPLNLYNQTFGKIGYDVNTKFFANNVAGKHGYKMTMEDYIKYIRDRGSGEVGAYGNKNMGQNAINARAAQGDSTQGVMNIDVNDMTDDTTDDTTNEDGSLILRFLHDNPDEVVNLQAMGVKDTDEMLQIMLDRAKNLYTT